MQLGTGWLGWTEQQTLATRIPVIELAYEGKLEMLKACYGAGEPDKPAEPLEPPKPDEVMSIFRRAAG